MNDKMKQDPELSSSERWGWVGDEEGKFRLLEVQTDSPIELKRVLTDEEWGLLDYHLYYMDYPFTIGRVGRTIKALENQDQDNRIQHINDGWYVSLGGIHAFGTFGYGDEIVSLMNCVHYINCVPQKLWLKAYKHTIDAEKLLDTVGEFN